MLMKYVFFIFILSSQSLMAQGLSRCEGFFFNSKKTNCQRVVAYSTFEEHSLKLCESLNIEKKTRDEFSLAQFQEHSARLLFLDDIRLECLDVIANQNFTIDIVDSCQRLIPVDQEEYLGLGRVVSCLKGPSLNDRKENILLKEKMKELNSLSLKAKTLLRSRDAAGLEQVLKKMKEMTTI